MRKNCYFQVSGQNHYLAIRLSDPYFLKVSNNLAWLLFLRRTYRKYAIYVLFALTKMSHVALHTWVIFTTFEAGQSIGYPFLT